MASASRATPAVGECGDLVERPGWVEVGGLFVRVRLGGLGVEVGEVEEEVVGVGCLDAERARTPGAGSRRCRR
jgi:hypothetical protein